MQKWHDLLNSLELTSSIQDVWTEQSLANFEAEKNIILPQAYKEYCQVFGTGMFGEFIGIFCPNEYCLGAGDLSIDAIRYTIQNYVDPIFRTHLERVMSINSISILLDNAFVFGDDDRGNITLWDLRTYGLDDNYDIYWVNAEDFCGYIHKVGRDFYEYVTEFCLGTRVFEVLPEEVQPPPEFIYRTFSPSPKPPY